VRAPAVVRRTCKNYGKLLLTLKYTDGCGPNWSMFALGLIELSKETKGRYREAVFKVGGTA
jgi:hypothetical protein